MQPVSILVLAAALLALPACSEHADCAPVIAAFDKADATNRYAMPLFTSAGSDNGGLRWVYGSSVVPPAPGAGK